ncbi:MAG: acetyl-CoA carboxylase biotin carboxyl carrier protein [Bacteroidota bacterium]
MEFKEIQDLIKLVNKSTLTEVEIEHEDFKLKIKRKSPENSVIYTAPQTAVAPVATAPSPTPVSSPANSPSPLTEAADEAPKAEPSNLVEFKSPMIGTFYRASSPDTPVFAKVGDTVQKGDVLCIIEAMKLFNEIESEIDGKIVKIMVEDAQPVEYDQVLFLIEPAG